ncbi:Protein translocase subunit [Saliniradius amylolyticus]|uniref:Protein translocase subunit SecD n=2 Tax=Saliniradius amylolyticus TaxID=2183582 RepID=A0A2S2E502_9ALTE|nr:Protein translocase subunit [Saliniradius amylolyticus]
MVILVVAVCALYASPNLYGEDPAVQVSAGRNAEVNTQTLEQVQQTLQQQNIDAKGVALEEQQILVRLNSDDAQLPTREALERALGDDYVVALNLAPATPDWLESLGAGPMKLGLDLRGGVHFLMEVDMSAALGRALENLEEDFRTSLREERLRYRRVELVENGLEVQFRDAETLEQAVSFLEEKNPQLRIVEGDELTIKATLTEQRLKEIREYALKQNITIMRNRVNQLGVAEPVIQRQGADRIVVQLPGIQDTARAKEILNATATLQFRMVDLDHDVRDAVEGRVPPGSQLLMDRNGQPQLLEKRIMLTGDHIVDANSAFDEYGRPQVSIKLDSEGGDKMSRGTKDNIGKPMATVFIEYKPTPEKDDEGKTVFEKHEEVINVATIQARLGRDFRITGLDSPQEAQNLSLLLRAGALVAPIQIVEERTIGPSLGAENINLGMQAIIWGLCLVLAFMVLYYKKFGIVANMALLVNLVMIVGVMSLIPGATLTLPGMAGIVLTVGMAVDANVLIFERIREELRDGRSPQQAIHHGYDSALSTIADANITTLIAAIILFAVGTGPIKGFSVTLAIGILTSMFTAIVGTRAIVNSVWGGKRLEKLSI